MTAKNKFVFVSGGRDSVALAHYLLEKEWSWRGCGNRNPVVVYLETTVGMPINRLYVEFLCDYYGWHLWKLRTHEDFEDMVDDHGFPGAAQHSKAYNMLKGRQVGKLIAVSENPHFYAGFRRRESDRRSRNVELEQPERNATLHSPLMEWSDVDVKEYIEMRDIPPSPLWDNSHPKDCWCGAYGHPEEKIEAEAEGYSKFVEFLERFEHNDDKKGMYGWSGLDEKKQRRIEVERDRLQTVLGCSGDCRWS